MKKKRGKRRRRLDDDDDEPLLAKKRRLTPADSKLKRLLKKLMNIVIKYTDRFVQIFKINFTFVEI